MAIPPVEVPQMAIPRMAEARMAVPRMAEARMASARMAEARMASARMAERTNGSFTTEKALKFTCILVYVFLTQSSQKSAWIAHCCSEVEET
jgi:hypothetical protein